MTLDAPERPPPRPPAPESEDPTATPANDSPTAGAIGDCRIVHQLGAGGMGVVALDDRAKAILEQLGQEQTPG